MLVQPALWAALVTQSVMHVLRPEVLVGIAAEEVVESCALTPKTTAEIAKTRWVLKRMVEICGAT
jgi:hypothetical protein